MINWYNIEVGDGIRNIHSKQKGVVKEKTYRWGNQVIISNNFAPFNQEYFKYWEKVDKKEGA